MDLPKIRPIIPRKSTKAPDLSDPDTLVELKHDGYRAVLYIDHATGYFVSRSNRVMREFQHLADAIHDEIGVDAAILDGEIVSTDPATGYSNLSLLKKKGRPLFLAFDLLWVDQNSLISKPLRERKSKLERLGRKKRSFELVESYTEAQAQRLLMAVRDNGFEGVVVKNARDIYIPSARWYKYLNPDYTRQSKKPRRR